MAYGLNSVSYEVNNIEKIAGGMPYQEVTIYEYICSLQPKTDMIDAIMGKLDPEINGEAYYSLNRLKYLEIGTVKIAGGSEMDCQIGQHSADVAIVDGKVQIQLSLDVEGHERQSAMFTVCDMRDAVTAEMYAIPGSYTTEQIEQYVLEGRQYANQHMLWESISHFYNMDLDYGSLDDLEYHFKSGIMHFELSDLHGGIGNTDDKNGAGYYSYEIRLVFSNGENMYDFDYYAVDTYFPSDLDKLDKQLLEEIEALQEEKKQIVIDAITNVSCKALDTQIPGGGTAIKVLKSLYESEGKGIFDSAMDFPYDKYCEKYKEITGAPIGMEAAQQTINGLFRYAQIDEEIAAAQQNRTINYFGNISAMKIEYVDDGEENSEDCHTQYMSSQLLSPQAAYNVQRLQNEGVGIYLAEVGVSETNIDANITNWKMNENKGNAEWSLFLDGGERNVISADTIGFISDIDDLMEKENLNVETLSDWIRY